MDSLSEQIGIILVACLFFLAVAVGIVVLFLFYQKRQLQFIHDKKDLNNLFQRELLATKMEAQEEALAHVGRELHDNIQQLLGSAKNLMAAARTSPHPDYTREMADSTLAEAILQVRALSKSLTTDWLEKFDLITHLQAEADRLGNRNFLNIELQYPEALTLAREQQIMLFRMAQECMQNAIKHGKASELRIEITTLESSLTLRVIDNGNGFPVHTTAPGVGITNITTRAQLLGGAAEWHSQPTSTTVSVQIPYGKKQD
ncbi:MAG: sensor histidine kinase [Flammeovirgaceae bacterium]